MRVTKQFLISLGQYFFFTFLFMIGFIGEPLLFDHYRVKYTSYSLTNPHLIDFKTILVSNCSNPTDLPCSLQIHIDAYFFLYKLLLLYNLSIVIGMTYTWHRTVRLFTFCLYFFCSSRYYFPY